MRGCCHQCEGLERQFGRKTAERELRRFRRRGPPGTTRMLLEHLRERGLEGAALLDIGGGVGAIHHLLLDAGASTAVHVDVSPDYLRTAREEAARLGHGDRVRFLQGDFVQLAAELDEADVVTLDRVICCYPGMEQLVAGAAAKARRSLGAVYPREEWWTRAGVALANALLWLQRSPFRVYLHPPAAIDAVLRKHGFQRRSARKTFVWEIVVWTRPGSA